MAYDKRADIMVAMPARKILCELKRDYHSDVWTAAGYERRGDTKTAGFPDLLDLPGLQALRGPQDLQARWARPDPKGDPGEAAKQ